MDLKKIILLSVIFWAVFLQAQLVSELPSQTNHQIKYNPDPKAHYFAIGLQGAIILGGVYFWNRCLFLELF